MTDSSGASSRQVPIPPDDLQRSLVLARPDEDQNLPHIGMVGTPTRSSYRARTPPGATASSTCTSRRAADLLRTATTSRRCFPCSKARSRLPSAVRSRRYEPARRSTFRPTRRIPLLMPPTGRRGFCACARRPGKKSSSWPSASPWRAGQRRPRVRRGRPGGVHSESRGTRPTVPDGASITLVPRRLSR
jgi:hypothetical protein